MNAKRPLLFLCLAAATAALVAAVLAGGAAASRHIRIASKVTLAPTNPFHGKVKSRPYHYACRQQRKVLLFNDRAVAAGPIAKATTDRKGRWKISAKPRHGKFFVRVRRRVEGAAGTIYTCRRATSPVVRF